MWYPGLGPKGGTLGWDFSETVEPDGQESMKINCLKLTSVNGAILNLNNRKEKKNWIDLTSICCYIVIRIKKFKVGNCLNFLSWP